jgi:flagellar hook-length control protein FliK
MISAPRPAAPANSAKSAAPASSASDAPSTPFDDVLTQESTATTSASTEAALDLVAADGLQGGLLSGVDDGDLEHGDDATDTDPLAFLAALLAYPLAVPNSNAAGAAATSGNDDGIEDALVSSGKSSGHEAPTAGIASQTATPAGDATTSVDVSLTGKLLAATAATAAAAAGTTSQPSDATKTDAARGVDASSNSRAADWLAHAPRHVAATEHAAIATSVRDPRWADDFSTRIALMVRDGESSASLQLTPVDLGPVDVSITVKDSQATIHFGAAQADTRALIESSIPQLREMLATQGFQLMDASVSQGFARQPRGDAATAVQRDAEAEAEVRTTQRIEMTRLLDTYA